MWLTIKLPAGSLGAHAWDFLKSYSGPGNPYISAELTNEQYQASMRGRITASKNEARNLEETPVRPLSEGKPVQLHLNV